MESPLICLGMWKVIITKHMLCIIFLMSDLNNIQLLVLKGSFQISWKIHTPVKYKFFFILISYFSSPCLYVLPFSPILDTWFCIFLTPLILNPSLWTCSLLPPSWPPSESVNIASFSLLTFFSYLCFFQADISLFSLNKSNLWIQSTEFLLPTHH